MRRIILFFLGSARFLSYRLRTSSWCLPTLKCRHLIKVKIQWPPPNIDVIFSRNWNSVGSSETHLLQPHECFKGTIYFSVFVGTMLPSLQPWSDVRPYRVIRIRQRPFGKLVCSNQVRRIRKRKDEFELFFSACVGTCKAVSPLTDENRMYPFVLLSPSFPPFFSGLGAMYRSWRWVVRD